MAIKVNRDRNQGKKDVCTKGLSCGVACISKDKECLKNLTGNSKRIAKAFANLILEQSGVASGGGGGEPSIDSTRDKGFKSYVNKLREGNDNLKKAQAKQRELCKTGKTNTPACKEAKAAVERARTHLRQIEGHGERLLYMLKESSKREDRGQNRITEEEVEQAKKEKEASKELSSRVEASAQRYYAELEQRKKDLMAGKKGRSEEQIFDDHQSRVDKIYMDINNKYPNSRRTNPNDIYVDDEMAEAAYNMMPQGIRKYLNGAGSLPKGASAVKNFKHGGNNFDENGIYTGDKGNLIGQDKSKKWKGKDRGVVMAEVLLRDQGRSMISQAPTRLKDMQLEHLNDYSSHKQTSETAGNLGFAGAKENISKGKKDIGTYVDSLEGKTADSLNAQAEEGSKGKSGAKARAESYKNASEGEERANVAKKAITDDAGARKKFVKKIDEVAKLNKGKPGFEDFEELAGKDEKTKVEALNNAAPDSKLVYVAAHSSMKDGKAANEPHRLEGNTRYASDKADRRAPPKLTGKEMITTAALLAVGNNNQREEVNALHQSQIKQIKENTDISKTPKDLYDGPMRQLMDGQNSNIDLSWFPR